MQLDKLQSLFNYNYRNQTEVVFITKKSSSTSIQLTFNWRQTYYEDKADKQEKKYLIDYLGRSKYNCHTITKLLKRCWKLNEMFYLLKDAVG
jgi:hypothetical protein